MILCGGRLRRLSSVRVNVRTLESQREESNKNVSDHVRARSSSSVKQHLENDLDGEESSEDVICIAEDLDTHDYT